ncbi:MFS transporter [Nocardioides sp. cx-173]|uniref:MFS transporter n=1 Tax=Nocardioides sp. cx-173 TaxID=2898796 RepID=UPI001E3E2952|nr:MFS transporter [Nocardioides sp. cx-173]MCD4526150.1 YbfB/YjiJ family MFS transporter [Nocardioides sp. cx-173]UGB40634.1 YbfB/YjiJ family MFS transporter [Nocardioides sp. cx-173]
MKRALSLAVRRETRLVVAGTSLIAGTYGLVRLAYGLFLPDIRVSLEMSSAMAGYVASGASVAYAAGAVFGLAAATQARRLVVGALLTASVGAVGMALSPSLAIFTPWAVVSSMGAGLASPGLVAVVQRNVPPEREARAQARVNAGTGPGLVAAGVLALVLLPDWRLGFVVSAVLTAAAGIAVLVLDRPAVDAETTAGPAVRRTWDWVAGLWLPALAALLLGAASVVVWTYGRNQVIDEGASGSAATVAWIALGLGGTLTVVTARRMSALRPEPAWLLTNAAVAGSVAALGLGSGHLAVAVFACAVFGWAFVAASSVLIAWTSHLEPDEVAPGTALLFITLMLGQAVGSAAAGPVVDRHGLTTVFLLAAAVAVGSALCGRRREA